MKTSLYGKVALCLVLILYLDHLAAQLDSYVVEEEEFGLGESCFSNVVKLDSFIYILNSERNKLWVYDMQERTSTNLITTDSLLSIEDIIRYNSHTVFIMNCNGTKSIVKTRNTFGSTKVFHRFKKSECDILDFHLFENMLYVSCIRPSSNIWTIDSSLTSLKLFFDADIIDDTAYLGRAFFSLGSKLFFTGGDRENQFFWVYSSDSDSFVQLEDEIGNVIRGVRRFLIFNDKLYISAIDGQFKTWVYNEVDNHANVFINADIISNLRNVFDYNGSLLLLMNDEVYGVEPWIFDGTQSGTKIIKDLTQDGETVISEFRLLNGVVNFRYFNVEKQKNEVWRTDGTSTGTVLDSEEPLSRSIITKQIGTRQFELIRYKTDSIRLREYLGNGAFKNIGSYEGRLVISENTIEPIFDSIFVFQYRYLDSESTTKWITDGSIINTRLSPTNSNTGAFVEHFDYDNVHYLLEYKSGRIVYRLFERENEIEERKSIDSSDYFNIDLCETIVTTNILPNSSLNSITVYPNPASTKITIETSMNSGEYTVELYNASSILTLTTTIDNLNNEVSTNGLIPGVYMLILTETGTNSRTSTKIVIQP